MALIDSDRLLSELVRALVAAVERAEAASGEADADASAGPAPVARPARGRVDPERTHAAEDTPPDVGEGASGRPAASDLGAALSWAREARTRAARPARRGTS